MNLFTQQATLTSTSTVVYKEPELTAETVGHLVLGNTFQLEETIVTEEGATWYRVTLYNGIQGYIQGEFTTGETKQTTEQPQDDRTYVQTLVSANVRAEADINSANIGKVEVHQQVPVLEEVQDTNGENWYRIEGSFEGTSQGYIKASTAEIVTAEEPTETEGEENTGEEALQETETTAPVTLRREVSEDGLDGSHNLLVQSTTAPDPTTNATENADGGLFAIDRILILVILAGILACITAQRIFRRMLREIFGRKWKTHDRKRRTK